MALNGKDLEIVSRSDSEQKQFHQHVKDSKYFMPEEKLALDIATFDDLKSFWTSAVHARDMHESSNASRKRRIAQKSQDMVATAYEVFSDFSPMLQLVKDISAPYGGFAIGTISFFLMVANNRRNMETQIGATMTTIKDNMPSIQLYQQIYNDRHRLDQQLQNEILMAYDVIMRFCMEITNFYRMGSMRRWLKSMVESNEFSALSDDMQQRFQKVRRLAEVLLSKDVSLLRREISDLRSENKTLQDTADWFKLDKIQNNLGLVRFSVERHEKMLQQYGDELSSQDLPFLENLHEPNHQKLLEHRDFRTWQNSTQSHMLLLVGYNHSSISSFGYCWVSPLTMHIATGAMRSGSPCAVYIVGQQIKESIETILCTLLLQLLRQRPSVLRAESSYAELLTTIHDGKEVNGNGHETIAGLVKLALRVLHLLGESKPIWIILERVDRCKIKASCRPCEQLLQIMVHLVESSKANVRVLATVNGHDWPVDLLDDALEKKRPERVVTHVARQQPVVA